MQLLRTSDFSLVTFQGAVEVEYAILSHTWEEVEILFKDLTVGDDTRWQSKTGYAKIVYACTQVQKDGYSYIWIDTCCIDKSSSTELSEGINSMFKWYRESSVCYAYLKDTEHSLESGNPSSSFNFRLETSRWFTRGWTLQELIAPDHVQFYGARWQYLGNRISLATSISTITGIDRILLVRGHEEDKKEENKKVRRAIAFASLSNSSTQNANLYICKYCCNIIRRRIDTVLKAISVAQRMRWVSKRQTT